MRQDPDPEHDEWVRRMRERARLDAEELVPRPRFAVFGLSAPALRPAAIAQAGQTNGEWDSVTIAYGDWAAPAGPHVTVTTALADPGPPDPGPLEPGPLEPGAEVDWTAGVVEGELIRAIDADRDRLASYAGADEAEPAEPPRYTREELPVGEAMVCRHGTVWAARLLARQTRPGVTVTITGRGVDPESVLIGPAGDLRPYYEARNEILGQLTERSQAIPALAPAEGVAAFRALAEHTLETSARIREASRGGRLPRHPADSGRLYGALWQRAVREQQRIAGVDKRAAEDVVMLVINHLGRLAEQAPWFSNPRLRELAIDETLRHAMLGDDVPSRLAQQAWARYWGVQTERWRHSAEPRDMLADAQASTPIATAWRNAWADWAGRV